MKLPELLLLPAGGLERMRAADYGADAVHAGNRVTPARPQRQFAVDVLSKALKKHERNKNSS